MYSIPAGLKGLLIVAMIAAMKSAFGGVLNAGGAYFVKDIYQNLFRRQAANRELIAASYASTVVMVLIGFKLGIGAESINKLWGWLMMGLTAGVLAPMMLRLYWWRCNAWGMFGGMLLGGLGAVLQACFAPKMLEQWQFVLVTVLSFSGAIGFALATKPTNMDTLHVFYRKTRPFGWWGPVKAAFTKEELKEMTKEHKNDMISVPFTLLSQITIFLLPMQLVIKSYSSFLMTLPLFLVGAVGMYHFWWKNLPPAVEPAQQPGAELVGKEALSTETA